MVAEMEPSRYRSNGQRWARVSISVFLVVIASIVAANLVIRPVGYSSWYLFGFGWIWIPFAFFFLFFAIRWILGPWGWGYRRRYWDDDNAYYILRERFSRGEITREQFEQISRDLQEHGQI